MFLNHKRSRYRIYFVRACVHACVYMYIYIYKHIKQRYKRPTPPFAMCVKGRMDKNLHSKWHKTTPIKNKYFRLKLIFEL
jgi:DNA repair photolyase